MGTTDSSVGALYTICLSGEDVCGAKLFVFAAALPFLARGDFLVDELGDATTLRCCDRDDEGVAAAEELEEAVGE